jgi:hypothetical protein
MYANLTIEPLDSSQHHHHHRTRKTKPRPISKDSMYIK